MEFGCPPRCEWSFGRSGYPAASYRALHMFFPSSGRKPGKLQTPRLHPEWDVTKRGNAKLHVMTIIITPKCICSPPAHQHNKHQVKPKSLCYYRSPCPDAMQTRPNNPGKVQPKPNINAPPRELVTWLAPPFFSLPHPFSLFPNTNPCPTKPACILLFVNDN